GSRPELGVDAIVQMGKFLIALQQLQQQLASGARHPLLGTGSVHASLIHGGRELSSYPDRCTLQIERRTVPPESEQTVANELGTEEWVDLDSLVICARVYAQVMESFCG